MSRERTWLDEFLAQERSQAFVRVEAAYLHNRFNFYGIKENVYRYDIAVQLLENSRSRVLRDLDDYEDIEKSAEVIYGIVHSRFLSTRSGLNAVREKYNAGVYPKCPRVKCREVACLPYGVSEVVGKIGLHFFCPNCCDVYRIRESPFCSIDGAFFGSSYLHVFLNKYPDIKAHGPIQVYVPKIYGFKVLKEDSDDSGSSEYNE